MFRLTLPILFWPQEVVDRYGITDEEPPYSAAETRPIIFYFIAAISPLEEEGKHYTVIHITGNSFVTKLSMTEVDLLIQKANDKVVFL